MSACSASSFWRSFRGELTKQRGSHAAHLRRPGICRRHLDEWVPVRGTGQLAIQADNRDRSLRRQRQHRCPRTHLFGAAIRTSRPAIRDRESSGRRKHNRTDELGEGRTGFQLPTFLPVSLPTRFCEFLSRMNRL